MKKLATLAFAILLGTSLGCGVQGTDTSDAAPSTTPEQTTTEIQEAVDSGKIDPSTYGKE